MQIPKTMWRAGRARKSGKRERNGRISRKYCAPVKGHVAVYVMEVGSRVKIGISNDPGNRLRQIQSGQPDPVFLVPDPVWLIAKDAAAVERAIHRALAGSKFHSMGEWYFMDRETAAGVVARAVEQCGCQMAAAPQINAI